MSSVVNPQTPRETLGDNNAWQDEEEAASDLVALVEGAANHKSVPRKARLSSSCRNRLRASIVATVIAVLVAIVTRACLFSSSNTTESTFTSKQTTTTPIKMAPILQNEGWIGAMEHYRQELAILAKNFQKVQDEYTQDTLTDITPIYHYLSTAMDIFGFRAVSNDLFQNIEWYFPKDWYRSKHTSSKRCDGHGIGCEAYDLWWLWHYMGAIASEKLLQQGHVVLDGVTQQHITTPKQVMDELHRIKKQPFATKVSFHVEHGFIWHYLATTRPNLEEYPVDLAEEFCGEYLQDNHYSASAHKNIRWECFHGFGHGVFMAVAKRQAGLSQSNNNSTTMTTVFRPKGGFELTNDNFCKAFEICSGAPSDVNDVPIKACTSGIKHSYWLFSKELSKSQSRKKSEAFFEDLEKRVC